MVIWMTTPYLYAYHYTLFRHQIVSALMLSNQTDDRAKEGKHLLVNLRGRTLFLSVSFLIYESVELVSGSRCAASMLTIIHHFLPLSTPFSNFSVIEYPPTESPMFRITQSLTPHLWAGSSLRICRSYYPALEYIVGPLPQHGWVKLIHASLKNWPPNADNLDLSAFS